MTKPNSKLVVIDGNSIAYRAFFALPELSNAKGQYTNAVYGFTQMLLKLLQDEQPTHIAVAFDKGKKNFRHEVYQAYKGTRQKTPSELSEQFPLVKQVVDALAIPVIEIENYEADDIIGTLASMSEAAGLHTVVVSGDKDLLQLVTDTVHAALTRKGITDVKYYDVEAVKERFELTPLQIIDLKGLMGDNSDNIPGVPGVGEKTAIKLLKQYHSVEEVLNHIDEVSGPKLRERLNENRDQALLSKRLATITREVPISITLDELEYKGYDAGQVRKVFVDLGFKSLVDKISGEIDNSTANDAQDDNEGSSLASHPANDLSVAYISKRKDLETMWHDLNGHMGVMPDLDSENYHVADLKGMAVSDRDRGYYVSFEEELSVADLKPLWSDELDKSVFNVKSLAVILDSHGHTVGVDEGWYDTMIAGYLLNPSDGELTLESLVERELHIPAGGLRYENSKEELVRITSMLPDLRKHFRSALAAQELDDLYHKVEFPLALVLAKMETLGFQVNADWLKRYGSELTIQLQELMKQIYELAGSEFNINSPKQLGEVLFDKLALPPQKKTKTGYSTSADVLEKLAPYHDVVQKILDYRQLGKLQSTYVEGLLKVIRPDTGRVYTRFHQTLTATGRLSSSEPNLQNIPIRMEEGRKLRQAFEPSYPDWVIVSADYSQVELRILAHLSGDDALIEAFRNNMDIHTSTAATVFEVAPEEVDSFLRRQAKAVNFGIVYGISDYGLSQNLGITRAHAGQLIKDYFDKFPGVAKYMKEIVEAARKDGYVTTLLNRRRYLPDIHHRNYNLRSFAERTAMNTPIQGTAADVIKLAMVKIDKALSDSNLSSRMMLQVHDELIFECPEKEVQELTALVEENMENAVALNVPLRVDINVGKTWYEAK
ncbi:DNA polymerase I [Alicyclobacillus sp. SO9]|uniref:DNA polymerase I n=1 Tax=Alicyclobacillus sp. SO9 TaxID=2665646 RepID=UPI0018E7A274|nr:DNA polymerase I [Alicyclobacillus sp. SO9]QQE78012.1 DNA polymerase I [Alicyclobacillus sp. SO9]